MAFVYVVLHFRNCLGSHHILLGSNVGYRNRHMVGSRVHEWAHYTHVHVCMCCWRLTFGVVVEVAGSYSHSSVGGGKSILNGWCKKEQLPPNLRIKVLHRIKAMNLVSPWA